MALPEILQNRLSVPAVAAPLFIISGPELVIAQCKAALLAPSRRSTRVAKANSKSG